MPLFDSQLVIAEVLGLQAVLDGKASIAPGEWQDIPLASGWSNYGTGFGTPQCRKLVGNLIEVKGAIKKSSAVVSNEIAATLPLGYRPTDTRLFIAWNVSAYSRLQVDSSGAIRVTVSGSNYSTGLNFIFGLD